MVVLLFALLAVAGYIAFKVINSILALLVPVVSLLIVLALVGWVVGRRTDKKTETE